MIKKEGTHNFRKHTYFSVISQNQTYRMLIVKVTKSKFFLLACEVCLIVPGYCRF